MKHYFKATDLMQNLSKEMQAIVLLDTRTVKMEKRLDKLEYDIPLYGCTIREIQELRCTFSKYGGGS